MVMGEEADTCALRNCGINAEDVGKKEEEKEQKQQWCRGRE